ncbi:MAG: STAS domain-containing protein [Sphingomonadales bacterium]|nr:STAS domain-containing protein [Sphingomonadales bacterium]
MKPPARDVLTGLAVAGLLLPEAVAYAGIAGLAPGRALVAAVAGGLVYALVGRSRFAVIAPTSSSAAILAAAVSSIVPHGAAEPVRALLATALTAIVGLMFLGFATFRLGSLASFISRPVLRGFAFGLALLIIIRQLPRLFGVAGASGPVWEVLAALAAQAGHWNAPSIALGLAALAALLLLRHEPRLPGALMVIVAGIALGAFARPETWGVALAGPVALLPPHPALPPTELLPRLAQLAAPIALILFAESWGTMRALALKHGDRIDANRELAALGYANLASALGQGMPAGAGFSAGNANEAAGARSRLAAAAASAILLALALFAAPLLARIPEPVLAAVVIAALTHALSPAPLLRLFRIRRDGGIALAATAGVLALGVLDGMLVAIALSIANLLYDLARPSISQLGRMPGTHDFVDCTRHGDARHVPGVLIFRPNAPLIFANAESALHAIADRARRLAGHTVVLSLEESNDLDATALDALAEFATGQAQAGRRLILARAHDRVRDLLRTAGHADLADDCTFSVADAVARAGGEWQDAPI